MYSEQAKTTKSIRSSIIKKITAFAFRTGLIRAGRQFWSKSLTVLNYHRIDDPHRAGFDSFLPTVSAHPDEFNRQIEYLDRWFNVISLRDVINWLAGRHSLPPYAALITFDDGYLDNYTTAYPILRQHEFPAVIYLTSGHIDTDVPFYWDLAAYCFFHTKADHVLFPNLTEGFWRNSGDRDKVSNSWIESMKALPETQKQEWVSRLPEKLAVSIPHNYFRKLMMNWDQVREMSSNGMEFGGHTINHPILSSLPLDQARVEIEGSKADIESEIGKQIFSFAYPNGKRADLDPSIENLVKDAGFRAAFTLLNGPTSQLEARQNPYAIRRIFIGNHHTLPQFATLLNPLNRYRS